MKQKKVKINIGTRKGIAKRGKPKHVLFVNVKNILHQAQGAAYKAVNSAMVVAYWHVGKLIVEEEQQGKHKAEYGKAILQDLSDRLNKEFKGGYSVQNLRSFRQFYLTFPEIRSTLWSESKEATVIENTGLSGKNRNLPIRSTLWSESAEAQILSTVWRELSWSQYKLLMRVENPDARASCYKLYLPSEKELKAELDRDRALIEAELKRNKN